MSVSETVRTIAEILESHHVSTDGRDNLLLGILKLMPLYRDVKGLDLWESAFLKALDDLNEANINPIIWELFEFGRFNLYGAFDQDATLKELNKLLRLAGDLELNLPTEFDVTKY